MPELLVVDDDPAIRQSLRLALRSRGHAVVTASGGQRAVDHVLTHWSTDLVILDVMMPGLDGLAVARRLRCYSGVPILMLTAKSDPLDVVAGLEAGADDYVTKPVDPRVLDARVRALLRRAAPAEEPVIHLGDLCIDEAGASISRANETINLTATEFRLVVALARNAGRVLSRLQILQLVWDYAYAGDTRLVDVAIQRVRAKLEPDPKHPRYITTVRGLGYRMEQP